MKVDPRSLFATETVVFEDIALGDVIACSSWKRGRVVINADENEDGKVFFLADPDPTYAEAPRRMDLAHFQNRSGWRRYPALSALWKKATGVKPVGGFKHL